MDLFQHDNMIASRLNKRDKEYTSLVAAEQ